jgi:hypothetical protein
VTNLSGLNFVHRHPQLDWLSEAANFNFGLLLGTCDVLSCIVVFIMALCYNCGSPSIGCQCLLTLNHAVPCDIHLPNKRRNTLNCSSASYGLTSVTLTRQSGRHDSLMGRQLSQPCGILNVQVDVNCLTCYKHLSMFAILLSVDTALRQLSRTQIASVNRLAVICFAPK